MTGAERISTPWHSSSASSAVAAVRRVRERSLLTSCRSLLAVPPPPGLISAHPPVTRLKNYGENYRVREHECVENLHSNIAITRSMIEAYV